MKQKDIKFSFEDLKVWQNSIEFSKNIYELTKLFPKEEIYGLTNQIRRAIKLHSQEPRANNQELNSTCIYNSKSTIWTY